MAVSDKWWAGGGAKITEIWVALVSITKEIENYECIFRRW